LSNLGVECFKCGKYGHLTKDYYSRVKCYNCGKVGHFSGLAELVKKEMV